MVLKKTLISAVIVAAFSFSSIASANAGDIYVGADLGTMNSETGYRLTGGYGINENISIEGSYISYAEDEETYYDGFSSVDVDVDITGFEIAGIYKFPLQDKITAFAKGGMSFWDAEASVSGYGSASDDGSDLFIGGGVEYPLQNNLSLRGGIDLYLGDIDENRLYGGLTYDIK